VNESKEDTNKQLNEIIMQDMKEELNKVIEILKKVKLKFRNEKFKNPNLKRSQLKALLIEWNKLII
jgi:hypothetical protein